MIIFSITLTTNHLPDLNSTPRSINLPDMQIIFTHFLMFLESEGFLKSKTETRRHKKKIKHFTKYEVSGDEAPLDIFIINLIYLSFCKNPPIVIKNLYYNIKKLSTSIYYTIPDFFLKGQPLVKENPHYATFVKSFKDETLSSPFYKKIKIFEKENDGLGFFETSINLSSNTPVY